MACYWQCLLAAPSTALGLSYRPLPPQATHTCSTAAAFTSSTTPFPPQLQGLPFRRLAERLGAAIMPALAAMREERRAAVAAAARGVVGAGAAVEEEPEAAPAVPRLLPFTRWAASNQAFRRCLLDVAGWLHKLQLPLSISHRAGGHPPCVRLACSHPGPTQHLHCGAALPAQACAAELVRD